MDDSGERQTHVAILMCYNVAYLGERYYRHCQLPTGLDEKS